MFELLAIILSAAVSYDERDINVLSYLFGADVLPILILTVR
jgi:hypothetical protein